MRLERILAGLLLLVAVVMLTHTALSEETTAQEHPAEACSEPYHAQGAGWDVCWQQEDVRAQGLEINRAYFENESVVWKMGVPFSITNYEPSVSVGPFKDVLGDPPYLTPGIGNGSMAIDPGDCPRFHQEGTLVNEDRVCIEHQSGPAPMMSLWARYDIFNYRFIQGWHFDDRGIVEPFVKLGGYLFDGGHVGAEGINHHHHIYWRVDFDVGAEEGNTFQAFKRIDGEQQDAGLTPDSDLFEINTENLRIGNCRTVGAYSTTMWCGVESEAQLTYHRETHDKWRVVNLNDTNGQDRAKSYEFVVKSDGPPDRFSTFDAMVLEHQGDDEEIGHEVPASSQLGDFALNRYMAPPEDVSDPVVWLVNHVYHDTRDESRGTMVYHDTGFEMQPRNFLDENPSEATWP